MASFMLWAALLAAPEPIATHPWLDGAVTVASAGAWTALWANEARLNDASCPCPAHAVAPYDRWVLHANAKTETMADIVAGITLALPPLVLAASDHPHAISDSLVIVQSVMVTGFLTHAAKVSVSRPYPYLYAEDIDPQRERDGINYSSMWSGHTAVPMAAAVNLAYLLHRRNSRLRWWVSVLGPTLALSAGILQISAGNHFPSDVLVGALVGGGVGWLNPWIRDRFTSWE